MMAYVMASSDGWGTALLLTKVGGEMAYGDVWTSVGCLARAGALDLLRDGGEVQTVTDVVSQDTRGVDVELSRADGEWLVRVGQSDWCTLSADEVDVGINRGRISIEISMRGEYVGSILARTIKMR